MTDYRPQNNTVPEVTRREHDVKGTGAKKTTLFAYDADTDSIVRVANQPNADGTYSISSSQPKETILQDPTESVTYVGYAAPGTNTNAATWRILTVDNTTDSVKWADGVASYVKVWDNRATYTYS